MKKRFWTAIAVGGMCLAGISRADWPMLGGTPSRNMANPAGKDLPSSWSIKKGAQKNVLWSADLGTTTYGGVVVAGGKVYIGTNNERPKDPAVTGDKGIMYALDAATGKFLWQNVHDKLPDPDLNDWPKQGIASSPAVDGDKVFYVSNRAELVCVSTTGEGTKAKILWTLDMVKNLDVFPCYLAMSSPLVVGDLVYVVTGNGVDHGSHKPPKPKTPQTPKTQSPLILGIIFYKSCNRKPCKPLSKQSQTLITLGLEISNTANPWLRNHKPCKPFA